MSSCKCMYRCPRHLCWPCKPTGIHHFSLEEVYSPVGEEKYQHDCSSLLFTAHTVAQHNTCGHTFFQLNFPSRVLHMYLTGSGHGTFMFMSELAISPYRSDGSIFEVKTAIFKRALMHFFDEISNLKGIIWFLWDCSSNVYALVSGTGFSFKEISILTDQCRSQSPQCGGLGTRAYARCNVPTGFYQWRWAQSYFCTM